MVYQLASKAPPNETPRDKFKRLAVARTSKTIENILTIKSLVNRDLYEYTEKDIEAIHAAITGQVDNVYNAFKRALENPGSRLPKVPTFKLD